MNKKYTLTLGILFTTLNLFAAPTTRHKARLQADFKKMSEKHTCFVCKQTFSYAAYVPHLMQANKFLETRYSAEENQFVAEHPGCAKCNKFFCTRLQKDQHMCTKLKKVQKTRKQRG